MTRLPLKYVQRFGRYHYFRRRGCPRVRLPGIPGSSEFMAAYQVALDAAPKPIGIDRSRPGSLSAAIAEFYESRAFRSLTGGTPVKRRAILEKFREQHGEKPLGLLPQTFIAAMLDTMPPHAAKNWLKTTRHFIRWAIERKLINSDPTWGLKVKVPTSDGHRPWTAEEISTFEARHPLGGKARLALTIGLCTALRRSDAVRLGRQHIRDGVIAIATQKTKVALRLPVLPELQAAIDATPTGQLTLLVTKTGKSYGPNDFSEQFRAWCDAAGLPEDLSFHGLRKTALTKLANVGCTAHEIMAVSGHKSIKLVEHYTKAADQARLARAALERMGTESVKPEPTEVSNRLKVLGKK
jgi:integrase